MKRKLNSIQDGTCFRAIYVLSNVLQGQPSVILIKLIVIVTIYPSQTWNHLVLEKELYCMRSSCWVVVFFRNFWKYNYFFKQIYSLCFQCQAIQAYKTEQLLKFNRTILFYLFNSQCKFFYFQNLVPIKNLDFTVMKLNSDLQWCTTLISSAIIQ